MRAVALLLFFATAFGLAALWQSRRVKTLAEERALAERIQNGEVVDGPSGLIQAGWGVVVVGGASGVQLPPREPDAPAPQPPADGGAQPEPARETPPGPGAQMLGDFELVVEPGQTLSNIARAHYGTAARDVVRALARYNGLADENALKAGQPLKLPPLDQLQR